MLKEILPAKWRSVAYAVFAVLGVALGAVQVGFASVQAGQPVWLTAAFPVFAFVGAAFGFTATANVNAPAALVAPAAPTSPASTTPIYDEVANGIVVD